VSRSDFTLCHDPALKEAKANPHVSDSVMEMFSLKGKVCIVTGAGTGIGLQACRAFAEAGGSLAMFYRSTKSTVESAANIAKEFNIEAKAYQCDVSDSQAVTAAIEQVEKDFGRVDVLLANAGMGGSGPITEMTDEAWRKTQSVNYDSMFYTARAVGKIFKKQGSGSMICNASMSASIVNVPVSQASYNASKAGVLHFAKSLAYDWKDFARVNVVSPGYIQTDMGAAPKMAAVAINKATMGRQGDPRELKGAFLYFASDASSYATGSELIVDGGYVLA